MERLALERAANDAFRREQGDEWRKYMHLPAIDAIRKVEDYLDRLPPVMPEVIRCGKYQQMVGHSARDYCSLAERKEEGNEVSID